MGLDSIRPKKSVVCTRSSGHLILFLNIVASILQSEAISIDPASIAAAANTNKQSPINHAPPQPAANTTNHPTSKCNSTTTSAQGQINEDQWNFVMEEYDLMDYLQNLSAKYINLSASPEMPLPGDDMSLQLEAKKQQQQPAKTSDKLHHHDTKDEQKSPIENHDDHQLTGKQTNNVASTNSEEVHRRRLQVEQAQSSSSDKKAATPEPELPATSLASGPLGDHEIGESSWQYGIFDRFTRPRSTTTTPDPKYTLDPHSKIDMRHYNSDECGLRTYDALTDQLLGDRQFLVSLSQQFPVSPIISQEALPSGGAAGAGVGVDDGPIKELSHRRQRPTSLLNGNGPSLGDLSRWQQMEAIYNLNRIKFNQQQQQQQDSQQIPLASDTKQTQIANWPNKDEKDNYESYKDHMSAVEQQQQSSSSSSSPAQNDEFNLLARRNWLQQQLGNTLQMFANFNSSTIDIFNITGAAAAASSNSSVSSLGAGLRENMMKKFGNLRLAKSSLVAAATSGADQAQPKSAAAHSSSSSSDYHSMSINDAIDELKARQDELKLEPRVIGGNDARLGDSPWSVSLQALVSRPGTGQVEYRHYCGGTIISEHYILTAAHCLDFMVGRESRLFVVIGDLNWRMSAASQFGRRFGIDKLIIHSGYKNTAFGHDIGLIRTKDPMKPLKVNGRYIINSVCLPEKGVEHTGEAELVGWGLFSNRNEMADSLQIAEVPILPRPLCVDLYRRRTGLIQWLIGIELITEKQVCAGTFGRGICQGDSGSALVFNEKQSSQPITSGGGGGGGAGNGNGLGGAGASSSLSGSSSLSAISSILSGSPLSRRHADDSRATIIGVVAFGGIRRCSYQSLPGVYMQTSKYMDWILPRIQA